MSARIRHPNLNEKLRLLYKLGLNPGINSNADLARFLGVSKQAVSKWAKGDSMSVGNQLPKNQIEPMATLFGIPSATFTFELAKFSEVLTSKVESKIFSDINPQPKFKIFTSMLPITELNAMGRDHEMEALNEFLIGSETHVVQIVAFGGIGKSTLVNSWLHKLEQHLFRDVERVYAWSFGWQGQSEQVSLSADLFLESALEWFGDQNCRVGSPWSKATRLATLIRKYRTILILDGIETLQHSPDADGGIIDDPGLSVLVREMSSNLQGLCVLTSRVVVPGIEKFYDPNVKTIALGPLTVEVGVDLLRGLGVHGNETDLIKAVNEYRGHALSLCLLSGYLKMVHGGDVARSINISRMAEKNCFFQGAQNLMQGYLNWVQSPSKMAVLILVCLFDRMVSICELEKVANFISRGTIFDTLVDLEIDEWGILINALVSAQLISQKTYENQKLLVCHPLVCDYFLNWLKKEHPKSWEAGHFALFQLLQDSVTPSSDTGSGLDTLFQAVIHGCLANQHAEAFKVYETRIKKGQITILSMGSHHSDLACLKMFFKRAWDKPIDVIQPKDQHYLLSCVASNLVSLGHIAYAIDPLQQSIEGLFRQGEIMKATIASATLGSMLMYTGAMSKALGMIKNIEEVVRNLGDPALIASVANYKAHAMHLMGFNTEAKELFDSSFEVFHRHDPPDSANFPIVSCFHSLYLTDVESPERGLERGLLTFRWRKVNSWQSKYDTTTVVAMDYLSVGYAYIRLGDYDRARPYIEAQIDMLRAVDDWLFLPFGLNYRSILHIECLDYELALSDLKEAIAVSERTGAKLILRSSFYNMCLLNIRLKNYDQVKEYFSKAQDLDGMRIYNDREHDVRLIENYLKC